VYEVYYVWQFKVCGNGVRVYCSICDQKRPRFGFFPMINRRSANPRQDPVVGFLTFYYEIPNRRKIFLFLLTTSISHKKKEKETNKQISTIHQQEIFCLTKPIKNTKILTMMLTMTKSVLLSVLAAAATTSSVFANPQRIVGGNKADPGDYPYFGK
jgi:hypothetical protein